PVREPGLVVSVNTLTSGSPEPYPCLRVQLSRDVDPGRLEGRKFEDQMGCRLQLDRTKREGINGVSSGLAKSRRLSVLYSVEHAELRYRGRDLWLLESK